MVTLYLALTGLLLSMQHRCQKAFEEQERPSMRQLEQYLDRENERLDAVLKRLFRDHRELGSGQDDIPPEHLVTPEIEAAFRALEEKVLNGQK